MKGVPLPFEFQRKGVVPCAEKVVHFQDFVSKKRKYFEEPKSVLDNINSSPSPPTSTSTLSGGGGGGGGGGGFTAVSGNLEKWVSPENQENRLPEQHVVNVTVEEKCGEMEDWESVLSETGQEQSILRWIMGDVEDPSMGLNKMLHGGATAEDGGGMSTGFGVVDQGYLGFDSGNINQISHKFNEKHGLSNLSLTPPPPPSLPAAVAMFSGHNHQKVEDPHSPFVSRFNSSQIHLVDVKPQLVINQNQSQPHQNPSFFVPLEHQTLNPPHPKRYNSGSTQSNFQMHKTPFLDSPPNPLQLPSSIKKMSGIDELDHHHHHQGIIDQLFKAAEMVQSGNNPLLAQSILARLNHQLSPIGKPFDRAAFYFKEALQSLIHSVVNNMNPIASPFSLIFKIGAYKSFSEVSPLVQFTNFTCNQALLEVLDGFDQVHIVDFDIRYGDQWASFMQELALRSNNNRTPSLKITTFASPTNDHIELGLTRDNLIQFASEMNIGFDFEIVNIDVLASVSWSLPFRASDNEAIAVNLPISTVSNFQIPLPLVIRFIKNLSPKIVVSVDRGCERTDLPFPSHLIHALQSVSNLLESLDAANMTPDSLQKIERFLIQPGVEKIITGRFSFPEKTQHWRSQFVSSGFSPLTFSNFAESQALCVIKRTPIRGFHVERRQSALVLCWQHRELVSASAWRC
ncbi:putative transcription factor GRAS family [Helianthus debilis subsp. tardiflorus]